MSWWPIDTGLIEPEFDEIALDELAVVEAIRSTGMLTPHPDAWGRGPILDLSTRDRFPSEEELDRRAREHQEYLRRIAKREQEYAAELALKRRREREAEPVRKGTDTWWHQEYLRQQAARSSQRLPQHCSQGGWRPGRTWGGWVQGQIRWSWGGYPCLFSFAAPSHDHWTNPMRSFRKAWGKPYSSTIPSRFALHFLMYSRA